MRYFRTGVFKLLPKRVHHFVLHSASRHAVVVHNDELPAWFCAHELDWTIIRRVARKPTHRRFAAIVVKRCARMRDEKTIFMVGVEQTICRNVLERDAAKIGAHFFNVFSEFGLFAEVLLERKRYDNLAIFIFRPAGVVKRDCSSLNKDRKFF